MSGKTYNTCNSELVKISSEMGTNQPPPRVYLGGFDNAEIQPSPCDLKYGLPGYPWGDCPAGYKDGNTGQAGYDCYSKASNMGNFNFACPGMMDKTYSYYGCGESDAITRTIGIL